MQYSVINNKRVRNTALLLGITATLDVFFLPPNKPLFFFLNVSFIITSIIAFIFARYQKISGWVLTITLLAAVVLGLPFAYVVETHPLLVIAFIVPPLVGGFLVSSDAAAISATLMLVIFMTQIFQMQDRTADVLPFILIYTCGMGMLWFIIRHLEESVEFANVAAQRAIDAQTISRKREQELTVKKDEINTLYVDQRSLMTTIQQLEAPIMLLSNDILLVPLIGTIDVVRITKITERLLSFIHNHKARGVVIDISGIPSVNRTIADHVIGLIRSCQLMGTLVIVAGISIPAAEQLAQYDTTNYGVISTASLDLAIDRMRQALN